jgi:hypothetical protein
LLTGKSVKDTIPQEFIILALRTKQLLRQANVDAEKEKTFLKNILWEPPEITSL